MKPDWDHAPDWANYLAQNASGNWHWFQEKPVWINGLHWLPKDFYKGNIARAYETICPSQSLEERPK